MDLGKKLIARLKTATATEGINWIWLDKDFFQTLESFPQLFENRSRLTIGSNTLLSMVSHTVIAN